VLAAVDFDIKFRYVLSSWDGSTHDSTIVADNMSRTDRINIPTCKLYLGNAGYDCRPRILLPLRSTRYNLNEFTTNNMPKNAKDMFNL
jgi:hypothetical protein